MNLTLYISAFTLGFLSSFHCVGMCGPIALMLPKSSGSRLQVITGKLIYNSGRVFTYVTVGILFGMLGMAFAIKGFERQLSVLTGVIILVIVLLGLGEKRRIAVVTSAPVIANPIRRLLKRLFSKKSYFSLFFIGVLNGLLPCGFVYLAAAGATATGSMVGGAFYMALFGLGTFPMMMMISLAANYLGLKFSKLFAKLSPLIAIALALFLIYRGSDMKTDNGCSDMKSHQSILYCRVPAQ